MDEADGWTKRTLAPSPMLKLSQFTAILAVCCVTVRAEPAVETLPEPTTTWPPVGKVGAASKPVPRRVAASRKARQLRRRREDLFFIKLVIFLINKEGQIDYTMHNKKFRIRASFASGM